jgi:LysM repeat protein
LPIASRLHQRSNRLGLYLVMKIRPSRSLSGIGTVLLAMTFTLAAVPYSYSTPSEENISGSTSTASAPSPNSASQGRHRRTPEVQEDNAAAQGQAEEGTEEQAESVPGTVSPPHAFFPYSVRSGDNPGLIASLFGVSLNDLLRANHLRQDSELMIGQTLRVPNPFLARERELSSEIDRLAAEKQAAEQHAQKIEDSISGLHSQVEELNASNEQYRHDLRVFPWWRAAAVSAAVAAGLMFLILLFALVQWWIARSRLSAVAEMNESLRRLDYKYKAGLAKAELRFQELYGRRRGGIQDGQERSKTPEESEIDQLNRDLKEVLERHLQRLDPARTRAGRVRWRERLAGMGAPIQARSFRR